MATNQSGIGARPLRHGDAERDQRQDDASWLFRQGGRIDALFFCPHTADEALRAAASPHRHAAEEIAARFNVSLKDVPLVGDSLKDLQAAAAAGAQPILVLTGKGTQDARRGRPAAKAPRCSRTSPRSPSICAP